MKRTALFLLLGALGCSTRPQHPNPYVPPETQYSVGSSVAAAAGLMAAAAGASLAQDPAASKTVQTAGTAAMGAGLTLVAASLFDAVEVQKQREKFYNLTRAFYHQYFGSSPLGEPEERSAPPPIPEVPFTFKDPSDGEDP